MKYLLSSYTKTYMGCLYGAGRG